MCTWREKPAYILTLFWNDSLLLWSEKGRGASGESSRESAILEIAPTVRRKWRIDRQSGRRDPGVLRTDRPTGHAGDAKSPVREQRNQFGNYAVLHATIARNGFVRGIG